MRSRCKRTTLADLVPASWSSHLPASSFDANSLPRVVAEFFGPSQFYAYFHSLYDYQLTTWIVAGVLRQIAGEVVVAVGREYAGINVAIAVAPE